MFVTIIMLLSIQFVTELLQANLLEHRVATLFEKLILWSLKTKRRCFGKSLLFMLLLTPRKRKLLKLTITDIN